METQEKKEKKRLQKLFSVLLPFIFVTFSPQPYLEIFEASNITPAVKERALIDQAIEQSKLIEFLSETSQAVLKNQGIVGARVTIGTAGESEEIEKIINSVVTELQASEAKYYLIPNGEILFMVNFPKVTDPLAQKIALKYLEVAVGDAERKYDKKSLKTNITDKNFGVGIGFVLSDPGTLYEMFEEENILENDTRII